MPDVCWPGYETPETQKKFRVGAKKLSRIPVATAACSLACPRNGALFTPKSR
jgi:hypothetical protein